MPVAHKILIHFEAGSGLGEAHGQKALTLFHSLAMPVALHD